MTKIAFVNIDEIIGYNSPRSYTDSVLSITVYIVRDDTRFEVLEKSTHPEKLEEVALLFGVIERDKEIDSISQIWVKGEKLG